MVEKTFMNKVANGQADILQIFLDLLNQNQIPYCVIGGLAVNAYAEPVVSLDLDLVITADFTEKLIRQAENFFTVKKFSHKMNLKSPLSDLRIRLQTDSRYQSFIADAVYKKVIG